MARWWHWCVLVMVAGGMGLGCDSRPSNTPAPTASRKITVLASVYPMAEMVSRIGGPRVDAQWLVEGGQRPDAVEVDADLKQRANKAEVVVTGGPWDDWAAAELSGEAREARLVEPGRMAAARQADPKAYLWLDPAVVREMAEATRVRLTAIDPPREADYRQSTKAYQEEVDEVDRELREGLAGLAGRTVFAVRPVWGAMCARYGLELKTPVSHSEEQLTAEDFKDIARAAKRAGVKMIFIEVSTPAGVRQQIEEKTGLQAVTLDALGTSAADGRSTWARVMRYNLAQLKKGLE